MFIVFPASSSCKQPRHCGPGINCSGSTMAAGVEGVKLRWDLSAEEIFKRTDELIELSKEVYDAVGALKPDQLTYENCLKVLKTCWVFCQSDHISRALHVPALYFSVVLPCESP